MSQGRLLNTGLTLFFFTLPWQTRWIFGHVLIEGQVFEFGKLSLYATQLLVIAIFFVCGNLRIPERYDSVARAGLLAGLCFLPGVFLSLNPPLAFQSLLLIASAFAVFLLLLDERVRINWMVLSFVLGLVPVCGLGIYQVFLGTSPAFTWLGMAPHDAARLGEAVTGWFGERTLRAHGGFPHPNIFGGYLAVGLVGLAWLTSMARTRKHQIVYGLIALLLCATLFLTFSQSAWLGFGLASVVTLVVALGRGSHRSKITACILATFVIVLAHLYLFISPQLSAPSDAVTLEERSVAERVDLYEEWASIVSPQSLLLGSGIGNYTLAVAQTYPDRSWWTYQPVHSVPLLILHEGGIIALFFLVRFLLKIDILNFKRLPEADALVAFAMGNVLLVILFFDHYLFTSWSGLTLAAFVLALTLRSGPTYATEDLV